MCVWEADIVVASYNEWVTLWNKHERNRRLELSPPWEFAANPWWVSGPRSGFMFRINGHRRWGIMRIAGWSAWMPSRHALDGRFLRQKIDFNKIVWAGWEKPKSHWSVPGSMPTLVGTERTSRS